MTKDEYEDFVLRYKGCGACFPMYHTLSRFEKMWFSAIQKDVAELEKENAEAKERIKTLEYRCENIKDTDTMELVALQRENAELKEEMNAKQVVLNDFKSRVETVTDRFNKKSSQLTKAKDIIKNLMVYVPVDLKEYEEAEQFISEVEK